MTGTGISTVGFFGKLPALGDFVQRRLPADFVQIWDRHFQHALHVAYQRMGRDWPRAWQAAPLWRFVLPAQVCGGQAWAGVMAPSRDRVGRSFPMVLAAPCRDDAFAIAQVLRDSGWFNTLASLHKTGQAEAGMEIERFDALVARLPAPGSDPIERPPTALDWNASHWRMACPALPDRLLLEQAWGWLTERGRGWCLWWTAASRSRPPSVLATDGLPGDYSVMLDEAPAETPPGEVAATSFPLAESDDTDITARPAALRTSGVTPQYDREVASPGMAQRLDGGRFVLASTDQLGRDNSICAAVGRLALAHAGRGLTSFTEALLDLHASLRERSALGLDSSAIDAAVVAVQWLPGRARLLSVGAATVWHWRQGRLQRIFEHAAPAAGELSDLLFGPGGPMRAGLGNAGEPCIETADCRLLAGDRLLLLAGRPLCGLPAAWLMGAMRHGDAADSCRRIAGFVGLGGDPTEWPLALIEIAA